MKYTKAHIRMQVNGQKASFAKPDSDQDCESEAKKKKGTVDHRFAFSQLELCKPGTELKTQNQPTCGVIDVNEKYRNIENSCRNAFKAM